MVLPGWGDGGDFRIGVMVGGFFGSFRVMSCFGFWLSVIDDLEGWGSLTRKMPFL